MKKKLTTSTKNKMIAGVCGGIAEYFNVDATLVRIIFVLLTISFNIPSIVIYIILWAIMPSSE